MPLLGNGEYKDPEARRVSSDDVDETLKKNTPTRRQSQHSGMAKSAIMSHFNTPSTEGARTPESEDPVENKTNGHSAPNGSLLSSQNTTKKNSVGDGRALSDTPTTTPSTTAANSPVMYDIWQGHKCRRLLTNIQPPSKTRFWGIHAFTLPRCDDT